MCETVKKFYSAEIRGKKKQKKADTDHFLTVTLGKLRIKTIKKCMKCLSYVI